MPTLEVFFDYACPYCLRGHEILRELMPRFPTVCVQWHPCEAHPRPERYGLHSDLCARGMYYAQEHGLDLMEYHRRMYRAAVVDRVDIESPDVVAQLVDGLTDSKQFHRALSHGVYADKLLENNRLAWEVYQYPAVPSYCMNGLLLKAIPNIGVTNPQLSAFLSQFTSLSNG